MLDFFSTIISVIESAVGSLVKLFELVSDTISSIPDYLSFMPSSFLVGFLGLLGVIIVYKILGREG